MPDQPMLPESGLIHSEYLPFTSEQLSQHFATIISTDSGYSPEGRSRHLAYFLASAKAGRDFDATAFVGTATDRAKAIKRARQVEKDERFWVVTGLMSLFHAPDRVGVLSSLLTRCFGETPPFDGFGCWADALGDSADLRLFFEVHLPSPPAYRAYLAQHLDERVLIPYVRESATRAGDRLEGATKVDAMLLAPATGVAVLFEAKVLSDVSGGVEFDVLRNQMARNIDVMLDKNHRLAAPLPDRDPDRTCFALLTPEIFRTHHESKLYGWLLNLYREQPDRLQAALPHRHGLDAQAVAKRLGWLTWEDLNRELPGACSWLTTPDT